MDNRLLIEEKIQNIYEELFLSSYAFLNHSIIEELMDTHFEEYTYQDGVSRENITELYNKNIEQIFKKQIEINEHDE